MGGAPGAAGGLTREKVSPFMLVLFMLVYISKQFTNKYVILVILGVLH